MSGLVVAVAWFGTVVSVAAMALLFARLRRVPSLEAGGGDGPRISVIIPARDEEANLGLLLPTLSGQTMPAHECLVVDDGSGDDTAGVARRHGATVVPGEALPDDWYGKPWACHQGARASSGDWLLFLDADLTLEPDALERLAALIAEEPRAVYSVCPWHRTERLYEQGSVFFNLLMLGGVGAFTFRGDEAEGIGLFGQTLLVSREHYEAVGGHAPVRRTVLENLHLSREFAKLGIPRRCRIGEGCVSMRMFPDGPREMIDGWSKGSVSGAGLSSRLGLVLSSIWLSGLMVLTVTGFLLPLVGSGHLGVWAAAYLLAAASLVWLFRRAGRFPWWSALLFPLSLVFYQWVFVRSLTRRRKGGMVSWKGRDVA